MRKVEPQANRAVSGTYNNQGDLMKEIREGKHQGRFANDCEAFVNFFHL